MFDKFLNKGSEEEKQRLLDTIAALEKDNDNLRKRLSKKETRAREDPAKRQELEESLNRALTKIQVLEHELETCRSRNTDFEKPSFETFRLSRKEAVEFTERLSSLRSGKQDLLTICCSGGDRTVLSEIPNPDFMEFLIEENNDRGFVLFYDKSSKIFPCYAAVPPFPVKSSSFAVTGDSFDSRALTDISGDNHTAAFVLAHAGESFIGIADSDNLLFGELVRSSVKEKHSKGGWSQKRFERLRDEDIRHHAQKTAEAFDSIMKSHGSIVDYLVLMGDYQLADAITEDCSLEKIKKATDIKPDRHCGDALRKEIWSSLWYRV